MKPWVNCGLRGPGDLRRASQKYSWTWAEKGYRIVNKKLKTVNSIKYCQNPEQQGN